MLCKCANRVIFFNKFTITLMNSKATVFVTFLTLNMQCNELQFEVVYENNMHFSLAVTEK